MKRISQYLVQSAYQTLRKGLIKPGETVVIGISGGPDSVALTLILQEINRRYFQKCRLILAHLNHGIRGREAERDERFVRNFARRIKLPLYTKLVSIPRLHQKRPTESLESIARDERYRFLAEVARQRRARIVVVGHTLDDQAETILMRLLRGAGLRGLRGILPVRPILPGSHIVLVRPLLNVERPDISAFLKERRQKFCLDSSNRQKKILRNRIRTNPLPYLSKYQPKIKHHLANLGSMAWSVYDFMEKQAEGEFNYARKNSIDLLHLGLLHPALRMAFLSEMIKKAKGNLLGLGAVHYQQIEKLWREGKTGSEIILPGNLIIRREYDRIRFILSAVDDIKTKKISPISVKIPGDTTASDGQLHLTTSILKNTSGYLENFRKTKSSREEIFDYDKVQLPLQIRYREKGDNFQPLGMKGIQSIKKFFIDHKIRRAVRAKIPLLIDGANHILWVLGYRLSERVKVTDRTKTILKIVCQRNEIQ